MAESGIPDHTAYHVRYATAADAHAIGAAETNCNGDRKYSRLLWQGNSGVPPPPPSAAPEPSDDVHVSDSEKQYFLTRFVKPDYKYMVIGYFRDPALRPGLAADGSIPQIEVPDEATIRSGKEHIVGFAQWQYVPERSPQEWEDAHQEAIKARSARMYQPLMRATIDGRWEKRKVIVGNKKYISLMELYIDARYQRRGLGGRLVKWGIEEADRSGLPVYIEATAKGQGLYEKNGMTEVDRIVTDLSKYGGEPGESHYYSLLYREPRAKPATEISNQSEANG